MPIYEYICKKCGQAAELLVKNADEKVACSECGSQAMTRQLSTFAAHNGTRAKCPSAASCPSGRCRGSCPNM